MQNSEVSAISPQNPQKLRWDKILVIICVVQFIALGYFFTKLSSNSTVSLPAPTPVATNETSITAEDSRIEIKTIDQKEYCLERESQTGETILIGETLEGSDVCQSISDTRISSLLRKAAPINVRDFWIDAENFKVYFLSEGPSIDRNGKYILTTAKYTAETGIDYTVQTLPFGGAYTSGSIIGARGDMLVFATGGGDGCGGSSSYFTYSVSKKMKVKDIISYSYDCDSVKFTSKVGIRDNLIWFIDSESRDGRDGDITFTTLFSIDPFTGNRKTILTNFSQDFPDLYVAEAVPPEISSQLNENEIVVTDLATIGQQLNANWSAVDVQTKNIRRLQ